MAPSLRAAAQVGPYFVVVLGGGPATTVVLRLVSGPIFSQRCSPVYVDTP